MVESREAHSPREWLLHTSFIETEVCSSTVSVQLQAPATNLCLVRQVPTHLQQLFPYTFPPACMAATSLQTTWYLPPYYPQAAWQKSTFSFRLSLFQVLSLELPMWPHIRPLLWCATFSSSPVSFTFFQLLYLVRARVPHDTGVSASPGYATSHKRLLKSHTPLPGNAAQLLTCNYYEKYLKCCIIHSSSPQVRFVGNMFLFSGTLSLHPVTSFQWWLGISYTNLEEVRICRISQAG